LSEDQHAAHAAEAERRDDVVLMSALTGEGIETVRAMMSARLTVAHRVRQISVDAGDGARIAWLHAHGTVLDEQLDGDMMALDVRLSDADFARFQARAA
jgi:GTPase